MRRATTFPTLGATLFLGLLLAALPACGDKEEACPTGTELTGDELPCTCNGETVDALPGDGSVCTCEADGGFTCEQPIEDTGSGDTGSGDGGAGDGGAADTGSGDTGTGDGGASDSGVSDTGAPVSCPEDVVLRDADIPCTCGDDLVDALPGSAECVCPSDTQVLDCGER